MKRPQLPAAVAATRGDPRGSHSAGRTRREFLRTGLLAPPGPAVPASNGTLFIAAHP